MAEYEAGRSKFQIRVNCSEHIVESLMQKFIMINRFESVTDKKTGENYYRIGDNITIAYQYFKYSIEDSYVTLYAWYKTIFGKEMKLHKAVTDTTVDTLTMLGVLIKELEKLKYEPLETSMNVYESVENDQCKDTPISSKKKSEHIGADIESTHARLQDKVNNKVKTALIFSIIAVIAAFAQVRVSIALAVMGLLYGSTGLKSEKRNVAIMSLLISFAAIIIYIVKRIS
ncbi:MAG: hypothetical protein E7262_01910 [Lachnospiraceae bacterium]|nr:hypothetical protein [Lachnospiraceae bacterium]